MTRETTFVLLAVVMVLGSIWLVKPVLGQMPIDVPDVLVNPEFPHELDEINVTVTFWAGPRVIRFDEQSFVVNIVNLTFNPSINLINNTFSVDANIVMVGEPGEITLPYVIPFTHTYPLGPLPKDSYTFNVYVNADLTLTTNSSSYRFTYFYLANSTSFDVSMFGDLNGDNKIDIKDIAQAALSFGSYKDHPRWNPRADLNRDGKINIRDIALIAKHFGEIDP